MSHPTLPIKWRDMTPEQRREYNRAYRAKHKERLQALSLAWRQSHVEHIKEKSKRYYAENKEAICIKLKAYYRRTSERAKLRAKIWKEKNPDRVAASRNKRRHLLADKQLARYYRDYGKHLVKHAEYRKKNRSKLRAACCARSAQITETYAREMLSKYSPVSAPDWPIDLVRAKQEQLKLKRIVKQNEKHNRTAN